MLLGVGVTPTHFVFIRNLLEDKSSCFCPISTLERSDQSSVSVLPKSSVKSGAIPNGN